MICFVVFNGYPIYYLISHSLKQNVNVTGLAYIHLSSASRRANKTAPK